MFINISHLGNWRIRIKTNTDNPDSWGTGWGIDGYLKLQRGCNAESGYSYWASYPYIVSSSGGGNDDPTEEPTPTSESDYEDMFAVVMEQTRIVKKKDYVLSEGVQVGDIFSIKGILISSHFIGSKVMWDNIFIFIFST